MIQTTIKLTQINFFLFFFFCCLQYIGSAKKQKSKS